MQVIPAINETDFPEIEKKIMSAAEFGAEWIHLDVSDGRFTGNKLWNNAFDLRDFLITNKDIKVKFEAHLMVADPETDAGNWIDAGVKRIVVHAETVRNIRVISDRCRHFDVELFIAGNPDTPVEKLLEYRELADGFLVLAVKPGKAGQKFMEDQLKKIRLLRAQAPDAKIIVDGGVNFENALQIKSAGADMLVAASAIWESGNPADNYRKLQFI